MNEVDIIAQATHGDEDAQRVLYEGYYAAAFRLAHLLLHDVSDAEEVVQDAFVYVFHNLRYYDPGRGTFRAWLRVTVVSRCRNKRRRRSLPVVSLEGLEVAGYPVADPRSTGDPASTLTVRDAQQVVWDAMQQVSPGARDALILRYYEGLPYAEIGETLGCSPEAARARVAHGKVQLRRLLQGLEDESVRAGTIESAAGAG